MSSKKRTRKNNLFSLETLEQRLLLSGDALLDLPEEDPLALGVPALEVSVFAAADTAEAVAVDTEGVAGDLFANLEDTPAPGVENLSVLTGGDGVVFVTANPASGDTLVIGGGTVRLGDAAAVLSAANGLVVTAGDVRITAPLTLTGELAITADRIAVEAPVTAGGITFTADDIDIGAALTAAGGGTLTLQPRDPGAEVSVAGQEGPGFDLTVAELDLLDAGLVVIGREDGRHLFTIGDAVFSTDITFRAPEAGGAFYVAGELTTDDGEGGSADITFLGSGHTLTHYTDTVSTADLFNIYDSLIVAGDAHGVMGDGAIYYDTTGAGANPAGRNINITGDVDGQVLANSAYNGLDVALVADATGKAWAEYSSVLNTLTVHFIAGSSTTAQVAAAIENVHGFYNVVATVNGGTPDTAAAKTVIDVATGGAAGVLAAGSFTLTDDVIAFKAGTPDGAASFNGAAVQVIADSAVDAGSAEYSVADNALIVHIKSHVTTTANMAAAIGNVFNFFDVTRGGVAGVVTLDKIYTYVTSGGTATTAASGTFVLAGNTITVTAATAGNGLSYNGVNVVIVADATSTTAAYDSGTKALTVHILNNGTSTTNEVVAAIEALADFTASGGSANKVKLTSDYSSVLSGGDYQTAASGSFVIKENTISFKAGKTIDGAAFNGLDVKVVANSTSRTWAEYNRETRTATIHTLSSGASTTADVAAALGVLFNFYDVAGGDSSLVAVGTNTTFAAATTGGDVNHAASGSFTLNGDTISFNAGRRGQGLYLNAGTGGVISINTIIDSAVGGTTPLERLVIVNANTVTINGTIDLSGDLIQQSGQGTSEFKQDVNAGQHVNIDANGSITFEGTVQSDHGDVTLRVDRNNASGLISVSSARVLDGDLTITEARNVSFSNDISKAPATVSGTITQLAGLENTLFYGPVSAGSIDITANVLVDFRNTLVLTQGDMTLTSDEIDFNGGAASVTGVEDASVLTLRPTAATKSIDAGSPTGGTGLLSLSDNDLAALDNGFAKIVIGYAAGAARNEVTFGSSTFLDPLEIYAGKLTVNGNVQGATSIKAAVTGIVGVTTLTAGQAAVTVDTANLRVDNEEIDDVWGNAAVQVVAANGDILLKNNGAVIAALNPEGNPAVQDSSVTLTAALGNVTRQAGSEGLVTAEALTVTAYGQIDLKTAVDTLNASSTSAGNIAIVETDGIDLVSVTAQNGSINIQAAGTVIARSLVSTADNDANDITLRTTAGDIQLYAIDGKTAGDVSLTAENGAVTDATTPAESPNVVADTLTITAKTGIGATGDGDLDVSLTRSLSAGNTGTTGNIVVTQVTAGNLTVDAQQSNLLGSGAVIISVTDGTLTVASTGVAVAGSGNILLSAGETVEATAADIALNASVTSAGGHISLIAGDGITQATAGDITASGAGKTIDLKAGAAIAMVDGAVAGSTNGNIRYEATTGDITIGAVNAGTAKVAVIATAGSILDLDDAAAVDITAGDLILTAGTGIGAADNPLETSVANLSAKSTSGSTFIKESDAVAVTNLSVTVERVQATGAGATTTADAQEDLVSGAALVLTTIEGALTVNGGTVTASTGVNAAGNILLSTGETAEATAADIALNASISSTGGHISVIAADGITQATAGDITASGAGKTIDLKAGAAIAMVDGAVAGSTNGNIRYEATTGDITIGAVNAGTAKVAVIATAGSILDLDDAAAVDITAGDLILTAGTGIGAADNPLETSVANLSAKSTSGSTFIKESDAVAVTNLSVTVERVQATGAGATTTADAQEDLVSGAALVLTTIEGALTVNGGTVTASTGVNAAGNILLSTGETAEATAADIALNASVTSAGGNISMIAGDGITQAAAGDITASGAGKTVDVKAASAIVMADGALTQTAGGNTRYEAAAGNITFGEVNAAGGDVSVVATTGSVTDADAGAGNDVTADELRIVAGGNIGTVTDALETTVNELAVEASGSGGIFVTNAQAVTVAGVGTVAANRVQSGGTVVSVADGSALSDLTTLTNGGAIVLTTTAGNLTVAEGGDGDGIGVKASGSGSVLLATQSGDVLLQRAAAIRTDGRAITVQASGSVVLGLLDARTAAARTAGDLTAQPTWGAVTVTAATGGIVDTPGDTGVDIYANSVALSTATKVGELAADGVANPIETEAVTLTTGPTATGSINILEATDVTVIDINSGASGGIVIRTVNGSLTVQDGTDVETVSTGISVGGTGNILLDAQGSGKNLTLDASVAALGGNVTVMAAGNVVQTSGDIITGGNGTIDVSSGSTIVMGGREIRTAGGDVRLYAQNGAALSLLNAGAGGVGVRAVNGSISDGDDVVDILSGKVRLKAGSGIGSGTDPLEITTGTVSAYAGQSGLNILESDGVTVGPVDIMVKRVNVDGTLDVVYDSSLLPETPSRDARQSGLYATDAGFVVLKTVDGAITVAPEPAVAVLFPGTDAEVTLTADTGGTAYNGYWIRLEDDATIAGNIATPSYDSVAKMVTIKVNSGFTTADKVAAAINDNISYSSISGGAVGSSAKGTVKVAGDTITFEVSSVDGNSASNGSSFNDINIDFASVDPAAEGASYDRLAKKLTINIANNGTTTTTEVANWIGNLDDAANSVYFFNVSGATNKPINSVAAFSFVALSTGRTTGAGVVTVDAAGLDYFSQNGSERGVASEVSSVTAGGGAAVVATATLRPTGAGYGIGFTAKAGGADVNGVTIRILDDGAGGRLTEGANAAQTVYDGAGMTLDVYINNGYTTVGAVIDAVNGDAAIPFVAALTGSGQRSDLLHTAPIKTVTNVKASIIARPPGANNDLFIEAVTPGTAYNGVTIRFLDDGSITNNSATATYDGVNKILTIRVKSDMTDANAVIAAVNAQGTFIARIEMGVETANNGTGKIQSTLALTAGGGVSSLAQAMVRPAGLYNDILFEAKSPGNTGNNFFNGVGIRFAEYGINVNADPEASYDGATGILTITVQNQSALYLTDAQAVVDAVNNGPNASSLPFRATAIAEGDNTAVGSIRAFAEAQTGGGVSNRAEATLSPLGDNNDILFLAKDDLGMSGDVTIRLIDDGSIANGSASAVYNDSDPFNKVLTIRIQNGETTAATVINAVNSASNPFTASNAAGSSGAGVIHTPATIAGGGGNATSAWVRVKPAGGGRDFVITARQGGTSDNGVAVVLVHDELLVDGIPVVTYAGNAGSSRSLIIKITNGTTTVRQVIDAVNDAGVPFTAEAYGIGIISTGTIPYGAGIGPGLVQLDAQGAAGDLKIEAVLSSTVGAVNAAAGRDILFSGASGAVTTAGAVTLQAGRSIANTASTATTTIAATGQADITLTSGDRTAVASTLDLKATSLGGFTLLGSGLALNGANLTVTAGDDISIQGPIAAANETVTLTSADNISMAATVTAASIQIAAGTDGSGDVSLGAGGNLAGGMMNVNAAGSVTMADGSIISSGSETIHIAAGQDIALSALASAGGSIEVLAGGAIQDNTAAEAANISTPGLATLTAVGGIGAIGGIGAADLDTQVGQLDALNTGAAGDIVIEETASGGAIDVRRAYQSNASGTGSILISVANGTVTLVEGQSGVKVDGTGHILIQALDTDATIESDVALAAAVTGAGGHVFVIAADRVEQRANITTTGAGTIAVQAGAGGISMAGSATSASGNKDIRYSAAGNVTVGFLNAGTGNVSLVSTAGSVLDNGNASGLGVDLLNVQAAGLGIDAFVGAGELGVAGTGKGALETRVDTVAAKAGSGGISLLEEDGVAVGSVSVNIGQLTLAAGYQELPPGPALSGLSTLAGGAIVLQTVDGTITVGGAGVSANGAGNILLNAQDDDATVESDLILTAAVQSGTGRISLIGADRLEQKADVTTAGGSLDVKAIAGALIMDAGTTAASGGGNIRYRANGDVSIGSLNAGSGSVSIVSDSGRILDSGNGNADVSAGALRLNASLAVGELSGGNGPLDIAVGKVSAATGAGGISLSETGDISVENVAVSLWRVKADGTTTADPDLIDAGQSDLTTASSGSIVLAATGALTLKDGNGNFTAVNADTTGNIRLAAGGLLAVESGVRSGSGALTLRAAGISQTADGDLRTSGASIDVEATAGSIAMADGASALSSDAGDVRYKATGNILVGNINAGAGNVSLIADAGSITDNGDTQLDIQGAGLRLCAGGGVGELGTGKGALETAVNTLSAYAGAGGISLSEADDVTIGPVAAGVFRVAIDGTKPAAADVIDAAQSDLVTGADGAIVLRTVNGTLTVADGNDDTFGVRSVGAGNILLQAGDTDATPENDLVIQTGVVTAGGNISLIAADSVTQETAIATNGASIDVQATAGAITMGTAAQTTSSGAGDVRYEAATHIQVGGIDAGTGNIGLVAGTGSILDNDAPASVLAAGGLRLQAASAIGEAASGNGPLEIAVGRVSALAGAGGIALTESNDITVDTVAVVVKRVTADGAVQAAPGISNVSQSDLTATSGGAIILSAGGAVILNDGDDGDGIAVETAASGSVWIVGGGSVEALAAVKSGGDVTLNAITSGDVLVDMVVAGGNRITIHAVGAILEAGDDAASDLTAAILNLEAVSGIHGQPTLEVDAQQLSVQSQTGVIDIRNLNSSGAPVVVDPLTTGGGSIRFTQAAGDLTVGEVSGSSVTISAAGSVIQPAAAQIVTTGGGISIESTTGSIVMADGAVNDSAGGNIVYTAAQDVVIGSLNAGTGDVGVTATGGSIQGAGAGSQPEVTADGLKLIAGDGVGTASQPLDTKVNVISASSGSGGVDLVNAGTVEIGTVGPIATEQVQSDGTVVVVTDQPLIGITATGGGSVVQQVTDGTLNVNAPITTTGTGDIVLQARDVAVNAALVSESEALSVVTKDGATFSWTAVSGATQYYLEIIRNGSMFEALMVAGTRWIPAYIFPQGSYTWTVRPVTATGMGAASAPGSFQITSRPEALTPSGTITGGGSLTFQWTAISGATQYKVEIYKDGALFDSGSIDGATVWTSAQTFGAGAYQWTVQSAVADVFGLKSDTTDFLVPAAGAVGQPAPLNPTVDQTGGGPTFNWTAVSGVRWYRVIIEKDGQVFATQFLDNLTAWTPSLVFGAGTYRWTVQSWKTVGFGTVAAAVFTIAASPSAQSPMPGSAVALDAGEETASAVPMEFSTSAVRVNNAGKGVSVSASADDGQQEASAGTDSVAAEPASSSVLGAYGTTALVMTPDAAAASAISEAGNGDHRGDSLPRAEETAAAGIIAAVRYPDSVLTGEERASSDRSAASSSGQATDRTASLQNAEDGGSDVGQIGETGMDLVNARRGYIAPIDIVVGPMNDPGAKQASLTAKKIAEKPVEEQA